jgi:hypothetical protein
MVLAGASAFLLAASPAPARAQGGSRARSAERRVDTLNRQGEQYERDSLGRERKGPADGAGDRRRAEDLTAQVKRDFEGLQAGYNKIVVAMASGERADPEAILDSVAEVERCAARLRNNLALPRAKGAKAEKRRGEAVAAQTEEPLLALRKHIYSFVTNPLFESPSVLDVEQAGKAGRDLDMILELSEVIRRSGARPNGRPD